MKRIKHYIKYLFFRGCVIESQKANSHIIVQRMFRMKMYSNLRQSKRWKADINPNTKGR